MNELTKGILIIITIAILLIIAGYFAEGKSCEARWAKRGYVAEYTLWEGCMSKDADGRWH